MFCLFRYCLEEVPKDLSAEINWSCEDCRVSSTSSVSKAKSPTLTSPGLLDHGSGTPQIEPRNPCHEISCANDHLVDYQNEHPITSVNLDDHMSSDLKRKTENCAVDGAVDTISSSVCFKPNDGRMEEIGNEKSKKESLMLSTKDEFDNSRPLVEAPRTNIQFGAKRLPDPCVEAFDKLMIAGTSNCDIGGLGRSSTCFGLKEDEINDSGKEGSKRGLITPGNNEVNKLHSQVNGEGTNFTLHVKRMPSTSSEPSGSQFCAVGSFECYKRELKEEKEQYERRESKSGISSPSIPSVVKKSPGIPLKQPESHSGITLSRDIKTLDSIRPKEGAVQEYGNGNPKQRLLEPFKDRIDNFHSGSDGQGTNMSFKVEQVVCTSIDDKTLKRATSCETNALGEVGSSSNCFNFKRGQIEEQEKKPVIKMIKPDMNQLDDIHRPSDGQGSRIKFATERCSGTSIGESNKLMTGSTSSCVIGASGVVRSYACVRLNEGNSKAQARTKRKRRRSRRRRLIPQDKGERNNFHPVDLCQGNNIPVVAETVQGTPADEPEKQIERWIKTSDTFDNRYGEDKSESRSSILRTGDELSGLHPVIDRRGTNMNISPKRLPDTSAEPSNRHTIKSVNTDAQTKFPCQPALPSSLVWRLVIFSSIIISKSLAHSFFFLNFDIIV